MHTSSVVLGTDMLVVLEPGSKRFQALGTAPRQLGCTTHDLVKKAAASGRSALDMLRAPARAVCTAQKL